MTTLEREALGFWLDGVKLRLSMILRAHGVPFVFGPGAEVHYRYAVLLGVQQPGVTVERIDRLSETLAQAAGVKAITVGRRGWQIALTIPLPRDFCRIVRFPDVLPINRPVTALLGRAEDGAWLAVNLASPDTPHILVAGSTGSGKTALARTMIMSLALGNGLGELALVLVDPAGHNYTPLAALPHVIVVASDTPQGVAALRWLEAELDRRRADPGHEYVRLVAFIDELADLALAGGRDVERSLTRVFQVGRQFGVHVVACTQKPTTAVIGSLVKANFPVRLVGSVASPEDARVAAGLAGTGAERLTGRGDMIVVTRGEVSRLQAAYLDNARLETVIRRAGSQDGRRADASLLGPYLDQATGVTTNITDDDIRAAWASGVYTSRRQLEMALFGYSGGQAGKRVAEALAKPGERDATTSHASHHAVRFRRPTSETSQ
jgi:S-DNA-T family DNA segregation ATPase FtsK/SpoIIIE